MTKKTLEKIIANPVPTTDPTLIVTMPKKKLSVGGHSFELQVEDDSGNVSSPTRVMVIVIDVNDPTAVLVARDDQGALLENNRIPYGQTLMLDGRRSTDLGGGKIVKYLWTLVE